MVIDHGENSMEKIQTIPAGEFKARCLKIMDEVAAGGHEVVITKRGKAVAKLVPANKIPESFFGAMKGTVTIHGDIVGPLDVAWEVEEG